MFHYIWSNYVVGNDLFDHIEYIIDNSVPIFAQVLDRMIQPLAGDLSAHTAMPWIYACNKD